MQMPLGWVSDRLDRRWALLISSSVGAVAALSLGLLPWNAVLTMVAAFAFGGFAVPLYSLSVATVNDQVLSDEMVEAASALYVFYGIGSVVGPLVASVGIARYGPGALYGFAALVLVIYLLFGVLRVRLVPDFRIRGRSAVYRTMPRTTVVAFSMLRRMAPIRRRPAGAPSGVVSEPVEPPSPAPAAYDGFSASPGEDAAMEYHSDDYAPDSYGDPPVSPPSDGSSGSA
jgi:MFS family permease